MLLVVSEVHWLELVSISLLLVLLFPVKDTASERVVRVGPLSLRFWVRSSRVVGHHGELRGVVNHTDGVVVELQGSCGLEVGRHWRHRQMLVLSFLTETCKMMRVNDLT